MGETLGRRRALPSAVKTESRRAKTMTLYLTRCARYLRLHASIISSV